MKNYHYFLCLMLFACASHAMEEKPTVIKNLSTLIFVEETKLWQSLYSLLRYPSDAFKKTDIIEIFTHPLDDNQKPKDGKEDLRVPEIGATKHGTLNSLTDHLLAHIAGGYATYHYGIKSLPKENKNMNVGALVINVDMPSTSPGKNDWYLKRERNAVCTIAIERKIKKDSYKTNELS